MKTSKNLSQTNNKAFKLLKKKKHKIQHKAKPSSTRTRGVRVYTHVPRERSTAFAQLLILSRGSGAQGLRPQGGPAPLGGEGEARTSAATGRPLTRHFAAPFVIQMNLTLDMCAMVFCWFFLFLL